LVAIILPFSSTDNGRGYDFSSLNHHCRDTFINDSLRVFKIKTTKKNKHKISKD
jgi:hypothetical protein